MKYRGNAGVRETELVIEREGLRIGREFLDYADVSELRPVNHRVFIDTASGDRIEISMLGFSYDGFWKELTDCYGNRSIEALFIDEEQQMLCEGEYDIPGAKGRANIALYPDSICILPPNRHAIRIPLCFTRELTPDDYSFRIVMESGAAYTIGKMGYDTKPFIERATRAAAAVKRARAQAMEQTSLTEPFTHKGLFRTGDTGNCWNAAVNGSVCALEFFTGEDTATYLYRFSESGETFLANLREATEAMGIHREIIYLPDDQIAAKPLYRMAVDRSEAVRYLRARSDGRLIHTANHATRLREYLDL